MTDTKLKPTNKEIAGFVRAWIELYRDNPVATVFRLAYPDESEFDDVREMFSPPMYDSIQKYVDEEK